MTSASPLIADMLRGGINVCKVPEADVAETASPVRMGGRNGIVVVTG